MVTRATRLLRHLLSPHWRVRVAFPPHSLHAIEQAIQKSESRHRGQIRFAVETALDFPQLMRNESARQRAVEVFSRLRVWDTEHNNGVLIYLLLADRAVEIIADRGIHTRVGTDAWGAICQEMEAQFRQGRFEEGVLAGIKAVGKHMAHHYPGEGPQLNELPDAPIVL